MPSHAPPRDQPQPQPPPRGKEPHPPQHAPGLPRMRATRTLRRDPPPALLSPQSASGPAREQAHVKRLDLVNGFGACETARPRGVSFNGAF